MPETTTVPTPAPAPVAVEDTVRSIEDTVSHLKSEGDVKLDLNLNLDEKKGGKSADSTQTFKL